ncbi:MAG TPA: Rrf2 family transcriptional regulator [Actinomycetota bacterium]|nr:Rrf2 family transcriptional regulator [Actinomycetota bacterium]
MDLALSYRGNYAVRAAVYLARAWSRAGTARVVDIAEGMGLPPSYTPQVLGYLARAEIVISRAGRGGGFRLARAPTEISLLEVVEATDGHLVLERCPLRDAPCGWDDPCALHPAWSRAATGVARALGETSLAELATRFDQERRP